MQHETLQLAKQILGAGFVNFMFGILGGNFLNALE
jgi:hypothetical protein